MSETKKRKVHTAEYKVKVGLEELRSGKTINQVGQEFDVHPVQWPWPKSAASLPAVDRQLVAECERWLRL